MRSAASITGRLLQAGDDGYDDARRVHNGLIDRRPALIVRCRTAADVAEAVRFARRWRLEISVRGGGHNVAGLAVADDAVMIDLAEMKDIQVDPQARTARAEGGVTWAELNAAAGRHGLAVTGGAISTTGIAGLTLGGGLGWLMREVRPRSGQRARDRARDRRRRDRRGHGSVGPRPVLGVARRRRELRDRDRVHLPAAPARAW